jgi:pimeloyl-ACP methyl ester carboxylesterase
MKLYVETFDGGRHQATSQGTLLLLHGLGLNGAAWRGVVAQLTDWPGRILVPDLRGHGRSPHGGPYSLGQHAADLAQIIGNGPVIIAGHSMGGMIGLVLASGWFGVEVVDVLAFGFKVSWTENELVKLSQFAASPMRWFDTRQEAAERFIRVNGLTGLVSADSPVVDAGLVQQNGRFRLAADPKTVLVVGPQVAPVLGAVRSTWRLAGGTRDPLVTLEELRAYDVQTIELPGCGHNPHIEDPALIAALISRPRNAG